MDLAATLWLVLMVVFLLVEAACPIHLVSVWFALGALIAMITALLGGPVWLQITLFIAASALLLASLWPIVRKVITPNLTKTNVDSVIGTVGIVTAPIDNVTATGEVKLGAMVWTARSTSGAHIPEGTLVRVDKVEGVKVLVSPAEVPANA